MLTVKWAIKILVYPIPRYNASTGIVERRAYKNFKFGMDESNQNAEYSKEDSDLKKECEGIQTAGKGESFDNQRRNKEKKKRKNNEDGDVSELRPPNYFLGVSVANPQITGGLKAVQNSVVEHDKRLKQAIVNSVTAHLTLFILFLPDEKAVHEACTVLESCKEEFDEILNRAPLSLDVSTLGHFGNKVLFAKVAPGESVEKLTRIADLLKKKFEPFKTSNKFDYKPHITLMKLSKIRKKGKKVRHIERKYYQNFENINFGTESVKSVKLLSMFKKKQPDGYYHCDCEVVLDSNHDDDATIEMPTDIQEKPNDIKKYSEYVASYCTVSAFCKVSNETSAEDEENNNTKKTEDNEKTHLM